jgi:predicted  nucleic acid-binding Zn-ribbon protein
MMTQKLLRDCKISIPTPLPNSLLLWAVVAPASRIWSSGSRAVFRRCPVCGGNDFANGEQLAHLSATFSDTFQTVKTVSFHRACFDALPDVTEETSAALANEWLDLRADFDRRFRARYPKLRAVRC